MAVIGYIALAHPPRALRLRDGLEPGGRPALGDTDKALPDERVRDLGRFGLRRHDSRPRVNSGQPNFGIGLELDVIAAAVIGGASSSGAGDGGWDPDRSS